MADIVIKRKLTLEFIGDEYKDSYLVFKAIPVGEYQKLQDKLKDVEESESLNLILEILSDHFVEGIFFEEKVATEDLAKFDAGTLLRSFEVLTGKLDPKDE